MVATQYEVPIVLVQTSRGLFADDSWTTQYYVRATGGSEGSSQALGEHTLVQDFGVIKAQTAAAFASVGLAPDIGRTFLVDDLVGLVVRLLKQDPDGAITIRGVTFTAFWWGVIKTQALEPDLADNENAGGRATWLAVGLASVLDGIYLNRGFLLQAVGSVVDPGYLPPFNRQPGGDRSQNVAFVNGVGVYVHAIGDELSVAEWTAQQILDLLIAGASQPILNGDPVPHGIAWALVVVDNCLDYVPDELDLGGLTFLQALNLLASTRRALTWSVSVSGTTATITVQSAAQAEVTVGGYTLPASSQTATLIAAGDHQIAGLAIMQDESSTYDVIEVRGGNPITGLTLVYPDHLEQGWDPTEVAAWNLYPEKPLYDAVWRRFVVDGGWAETGYGAASLMNSVVSEISDEFGRYGLTGAREDTATEDLVPGYHHQGERMLPCGELFSSAGIGPRQAPVVVVYNGSNTYEDMSLKWRVEVQQDPFAIVIDDGHNGTELRDRMAAAGAKIYVSVGIREHRPLAVSWQRDDAATASPTPRVKLIQASGCERWVTREDTVTGVVAADTVRGAVGAALSTVADLGGGDVTARDDIGRLKAILALARAWFGVPAYKVQWTRRGELDTGTEFAPGTLLTSVQLGDRTYGTYALITRRTWQLVARDDVEMWDTVYETQRVLPDLDVVL